MLHFLIAIGRPFCAFISRTSPGKHKDVKEVLRIAKVGWNTTAAGLPNGEETKCPLEVWPHIASTLGIEGSVAQRAVLQMSNLIRQLYRSWQFEGADLAAECETVAISFAKHVGPHSKLTYLFTLQHVFSVIRKVSTLRGWVCFSQDVRES